MGTLVARILGIVFLIVAVWGFIDGRQVLIFSVNTMHNVVHLLSGLVLLGASFADEAIARRVNLVFLVVYALVSVLGLLNVQAVNDLLNLNNADDVLHILLTIAFAVGAFATLDTTRRPGRPVGGVSP